MKRQKGRSNRHRIKSLRNYTIADTSLLLGVHRRTVREWINSGLPVLDQKRPLLIHGSDLKHFLSDRKQRRKQGCQPGELFCVKCRTATLPAGGMADYISVSPTRGSLSGICPMCNTIITQWTSLARLNELKGKLDVKTPDTSATHSRSLGPCRKMSLRNDEMSHDQIQSGKRTYQTTIPQISKISQGAQRENLGYSGPLPPLIDALGVMQSIVDLPSPAHTSINRVGTGA